VLSVPGVAAPSARMTHHDMSRQPVIRLVQKQPGSPDECTHPTPPPEDHPRDAQIPPARPAQTGASRRHGGAGCSPCSASFRSSGLICLCWRDGRHISLERVDGSVNSVRMLSPMAQCAPTPQTGVPSGIGLGYRSDYVPDQVILSPATCTARRRNHAAQGHAEVALIVSFRVSS
jgi:hypothetical protein